MEDQHQPVAPGPPAAPARQPGGVREAGGDERPAGQRGVRRGDPARERDGAKDDRRHVPAVGRRRQRAGVHARQPVAGEAGDDAAADQRDQQDQRGEADAHAIIGVALGDRFDMEDEIAEPQYGERRGDLAVVALAAVAEFARDEDDQQREEGEIDRRRRNSADQRRARHRQPAGEPQGRKPDQLAALQRQTAGPVGDRRQREAGHRRASVAVDHLVDVPVKRRISGGQRQLAEIGRQPQQNREPGEQRSAEEERPEAIGKQRQAVVRLRARYRGHRRTPGQAGAARRPVDSPRQIGDSRARPS